MIIADIRLADGLVFEAFDKYPAKCSVIFTTRYDEYAIKAFKYNGIDYLLKPVIREELAEAIRKVRNPHLQPEESVKPDNTGMKNGLRHRQRFLVSEKDGYLAIDVGTVSYIYSEGGLTSLKQWMDT